MPSLDIALCPGRDCPERGACWRYLAGQLHLDDTNTWHSWCAFDEHRTPGQPCVEIYPLDEQDDHTSSNH